VLSVGRGGRSLGQPTKHVRTHTHKLKPLNHFTVVPQPLSPLRFNTSGAVAVRGASPLTKSATAAGASAAAAASAAMAAGGGKEPVVASSDDSDATTNVAEASGLDKRGSAERVRLARGRHAMAARSKMGQARIDKNQAAIDLTWPDVAGGSSVTAPTACGDMRSRGAGCTVRTTGAVSARTGGAVNKEVTDDEEYE